jgi:hypothetical protein
MADRVSGTKRKTLLDLATEFDRQAAKKLPRLA